MKQQSLFKCMTASTAKNAGDAGIKERIRAAGERARKEAAARRRDEKKEAPFPKEIGGSVGPEPTRYGDWGRKGIASDF